MPRRFLTAILVILPLLLATCTSQPDATSKVPATPIPTVSETPLPILSPLVISEVQAGATNNENLEFIELYNTTTTPLRLQGHQLVYRLATSQEDMIIYTWTEGAIIPPHSHYLLVRVGQEEEIGMIADATFEQPLNTTGGGLALLTPQREVLDSVAWGNAPETFVEGGPAPVPENDTSIERLPGGEEGNFTDTGDNATDFFVNVEPDPQNSGSLPTPAEAERFSITLSAPSSVEPGTQFDYELEVSNNTGVTTHDVLITLNVPPSLIILGTSSDGMISGNLVQWTLAEMADGDTVLRRVTVETPPTYAVLVARDLNVQAGDWPHPAMGAPVRTRVEGGVVSIAAARSLIGEQVTVEGVATMYTGGYYAGTNNTQFYLQDESGGVQIQCFDEGDEPPTIALGDRVRVTGEVGIYRDSIHIVPDHNADDVIVLGQADSISPRQVTAAQATSAPDVVGRLIAVTGSAIRVEEFTYSYEIDLADDQGNILLVYVDKLTGIEMEIEQIEVSHQYTIAGISEMYDDILQLKPRIPADIVEVFPPVLAIEADAPHNALPEETFAYTFTVFNHTAKPFTNVTITSTLPTGNAVLAAIEDGGRLEGKRLRWTIPILPSHESQSVHFSAVTTGEAGTIALERYAAWADEWPLHETDLPLLTFIGERVPVYAIQGPGFASPYKLSFVDTEGVVTGVFPELEGFWIQGLESDDDPTTSEGLFVFTGDSPVEVHVGDLVEVYGCIRERSRQTELHITAAEDVIVTDSDLPLPEPVELDPPVETEAAPAYYEPLEGMLVSVVDPAVAIAPTSHYGEYVLVRPEHGIRQILRGQEMGLFIVVDDGSAIRHDDATTLPYVVHTGDRVGNLIGPLASALDNYKIEPVEPPERFPAPDSSTPQLAQPGPDEFSIATFNADSFFDTEQPHRPSDPPKPSRREYERKRRQIVDAILALGAPTVIGLQEIENIDVLEDVAAQPALSAYDYQAALIEGSSSGDIDVGFLVRGDRVTLDGVGQYPAPEQLFHCPPLMITMTVRTASAGDVVIYAIVNHFISRSRDETMTDPRRVMQGQWNAQLVDRILLNDPEAYVVVLGDLNGYYDAPSLRALTEGSIPGGRLVNVVGALPPEDRYSHISKGVSQLLDHILATPTLAARQVRVDVLHVNADYPPADPAGSSLYHSSDHDPVVATFNLGD